MAKGTFRGFLPADDPIYTRGTTILTGANINLRWGKKPVPASETKPEPEKPGSQEEPKANQVLDASAAETKSKASSPQGRLPHQYPRPT